MGEPFRTGLHPAAARAFFAERELILHDDEATSEAAHRLGVARADSIPSLYRLATLEVRPGGAGRDRGSEDGLPRPEGTSRSA